MEAHGGQSGIRELGPSRLARQARLAEEYAAVLHLGREDARAARTVAAALEDALADAGWPAGQVFGPERRLADNFDVAVPRLRQALRLLEARGACHMRRGPGGGLVVVSPNRRHAAERLADHLRWIGATQEHVWEMRAWFEPMAAGMAARGPGRAGSLAAASADPCVGLILDCLEQFPGAMDEATNPAQEALWLAIDRGQSLAAARLAAENVNLRRRARDWRRAAVESGEPQIRPAAARSLAAQLARRMGADLTYAGCRNGELLGPIPQLCERYHASHGVMIEAIRLLEDADLVESRRGRGGGVVLRTPAPGAIVPFLHAHIAGSGARRSDVEAISRTLNELAAIQAARGPAGASTWRKATHLVSGATPETAHLVWLQLQRDIYEAANNPILHVFGRSFAGYNLRAHAPGRERTQATGDALLGICRGIVDALVRKDVDAAARGQRAGLDLLLGRAG